MSFYVVDSSVVIKWYVPEVLSAESLRVRNGSKPLHAPDFLDVEVAAILWKKIRRALTTRTVADSILTDLAGLTIITRHPTTPLVGPAFDIADRTNRTVYDCLYLALAVQLGGVMVTGDDKLANVLTGTAWAANITKLQGIP
jgi:predicted nucleic acid-binding protein